MTIQVLFVDDDMDFLQISKSYLQKIFPDILVTTCSTVKEALDILTTKQFECIISDYQMPQIDGLELLKIIRKQNEKIPFIIFTGKSREEVAIEALNLGASQYLIKGSDIESQYHQLGHSIRQLVSHAKTRERFRISEETLGSFLDNAPMGIEIISNESLAILYANFGMEEITGYSQKDLQALSFEEQIQLIFEEDRDYLRDIIERKKEGKETPAYYEIRIIRKNSEIAWLAVRPVSIQYNGNEATQITFIDITHQKSLQTHGERSTLESEIIKKIKTGIYIYELKENDKLILIGGNEAAGDITGIYPSDHLNTELREIWFETEEVGFYQSMIEVMMNKEPFESESYEYKDKRVSGCYRIFAFQIPTNYLCVSFTDVTDLKQIQETLEKEEILLECLYKTTKHLNETCIPFIERISNVRKLIQETFPPYLEVAVKIEIDQEVWETKETDEKEMFEAYPIKDAEKERGTISIMYQSNSPQTNTISDEERTMLQSIAEQIGQLIIKQDTSQSLSESELHVRTILQSMDDLILVIDEQNRHIAYFPSDSNLLLIEPDALVGKTIQEVLPVTISNEYILRIEKAREGMKNIDFEYSLPIKGDTRWFHALFTKYEVEGQVLVVIRDITHRKLQEELVYKQREELSHFAHRMRHDIMGVLGNISGYLEIIRTDNDLKHTESIDRIVSRCEKILDKSITLADAGLIIGEKDEVDMTTLVYEISSEIIPSTVQVEIEKLPVLLGDRDKISQVIINIIRNAITHGNPTRVRIFSEFHHKDVILRFCNNGEQIPPEVLKQITHQEESSYQRGLGLSIVHRIIEAHGWRSSITSSVQTCFSIMIPNSDIIK